MDDLKERNTLRLNVSCSSRDKKFLVIGKKSNTVSDFITMIKKVFTTLYPQEQKLEVSRLQDHNGFDIFCEYKLGDLFEDNACLNVFESDVRSEESPVSEAMSSGFHEVQVRKSDVEESTTSSKQTKSEQTKSEQTKAEQSSADKKNVDADEKPEICLSSPENKRPNSDSAEEQGKRKRRQKNTKKKKISR